jgi:ABC-type transport system involved in multi-copper enzyme maturation permease subunit
MGLLLITLFTIQEVLRRRLFLVLFLLSLLLLAGYTFVLHFAIAVPASSNSGSGPNGVSRDLQLWVCGLIVSLPSIWLVYLISGMLTIFLAAGMISAEVEAGTFAIIVPKPLRRAEIVLGKWLGYALLLSLYTAFLFFLFLGIIFWQMGYWPEQAFSALLLLELAMLALLGLVTFGSTLASTLVNGAVIMILFLSAPIAGMISGILSIIASEQGTLPESVTTMQNIMAVINLVIPADALWHGSAFYLVPVDILGFLQSQGISAELFSLPPLNIAPLSFPLLIWTLLYITVLPLLATWRFQKRDL